MSVDPAAGSTVSRPTTRAAKASRTRAGGRAPRDTPTSPAMTPGPPASTAPQSAKVTRAGDGCRQVHQGGPAAGFGIATTDRLGPAIDTATMTAAAVTMPTAAIQTSAVRPRSGAARPWAVVAGSGGAPTPAIRAAPGCAATRACAEPACTEPGA